MKSFSNRSSHFRLNSPLSIFIILVLSILITAHIVWLIFGNVWTIKSYFRYQRVAFGNHYVRNMSDYHNTDKAFLTFAYSTVIIHDCFYCIIPLIIILFLVKTGKYLFILFHIE